MNEFWKNSQNDAFLPPLIHRVEIIEDKTITFPQHFTENDKMKILCLMNGNNWLEKRNLKLK